jgi:hypothetical protein
MVVTEIDDAVERKDVESEATTCNYYWIGQVGGSDVTGDSSPCHIFIPVYWWHALDRDRIHLYLGKFGTSTLTRSCLLRLIHHDV